MKSKALEYAANGYRVFSCVPGTKKPLTEHGFHDATNDPAQVEAWWDRHPDANIAIATDGLLVVDLDGDDNGWLKDNPELRAELEAGPSQTTPRGGKHFFFRQPEGVVVKVSAGQVADHVDVRANGGYIVVAPSVVKGNAYVLNQIESLPPREQLPFAPDWLVKLAIEKPHGTTKKAVKSILRSQGPIPEGERNTTLASIAGRLRWRGLGEAALAEALREINAARCRPPLGDDEVAGIAASISRYEAGTGDGAGTGGDNGRPAKLPRVNLDTDEIRVNNEVEAALEAEPDLYSRGQRLVRLVRQRVGQARGHATIVDVGPATLREIITNNVQLFVLTEQGYKPAHPPAWMVNALHTRGQWRSIRELTAISDVPFMRPDGTVCQTEGYDRETGVLLEMHGTYPTVPEAPTQDDARAAAQELLEVVEDFPFASDASRAGFLCALLTPLARYAFDGPAPLFSFDANVRGAGKTLLASVIGYITTGHAIAVTSYTKNQEELRKSITSTLMAGHRLVLLDNLEGTLGCATLDRLLTSVRWRDRVLGGNQIVDLPVQLTILASGNNTVLKADAARRVVVIRLESPEERPEHRAEFKHKNLLAYVRANRHRLVRAALTILRAYWCAGRPDMSLRNFGGFEGWSQSVRSAVVYAGMPDPLGTAADLDDAADQTVDALRAVMNAWSVLDERNHGLVVANLMPEMYPIDNSEPKIEYRHLRAALEELVGTPAGRTPSARDIGNTLRTHRRRFVDGRCFEKAGKCAGGQRWKLLMKGPPSGGAQNPQAASNPSMFEQADARGAVGPVASDCADSHDSRTGHPESQAEQCCNPQVNPSDPPSSPHKDVYGSNRPFAGLEDWADEAG